MTRMVEASSDQVRSPSGAGAVWAQRHRDVVVDGVERPPVHASIDEARDAGAVYAFDRADAVVDIYGETHVAPRWSSLEVAKLQAVNAFARGHLNASAALAGRAVLAGAPKRVAFGAGAGGALVYDRDVLRVPFEQTEFSIVEGRYDYATITVVRDALYSDREVTVAYSTEDLTAKGVDDGGYAACSGGAPNTAATTACGDYEQTSGLVTIPAGATYAIFYVYIVDDPCFEVTEYVQLSLAAPGSPTFQGEGYLAKLRIDDDDWEGDSHTVYCPVSGFL